LVENIGFHCLSKDYSQQYISDSHLSFYKKYATNHYITFLLHAVKIHSVDTGKSLYDRNLQLFLIKWFNEKVFSVNKSLVRFKYLIIKITGFSYREKCATFCIRSQWLKILETD